VARRLPLMKVIWGTFALPWMYRAEWFRAVRFPLLGVFSVSLLWYLVDNLGETMQQALCYAGYLFMFSWLAVCTHRVVLLDSAKPASWPDAHLLRIIALYLGSMAVLWLIWMLVATVVTMISVTVALSGYTATGPLAAVPPSLEPDPAVQATINRISYIAQLPVVYLVARLSPLLPAVALGKRWSLRAAWDLSRGNGWRLAIVVIAVPYLFSCVVWWLTRDGASPYEIAALWLVTAVLTSLEFIALSLSFRELGPLPPPPTDRPA